MKFRTLLVLSFLFPVSANAENPPDWRINVGLGAVYSPVYEGADEYGLSVFPDVRVNYKDEFFASVPEGVGYNVINKNGWKAGPIAKVKFGRDEDDGGSIFRISGETDDLRGMGDVDDTLELGGFAQYSYQQWISRLELRQGVGGHESWVSDASVKYTGAHKDIRYSVGPKLTLAGADYVNTYYGIDGGQSLNTGLPTHDADGGLVSYGIGASAMMPVAKKTSLTVFGGYDRLAGDAGDSPLVEERGTKNQFMVGVGVGYQFGYNNN